MLAEKEFQRVGGNESIEIDVRVICATNRNLEKAVEQEKFLPDLYDRLNVIRISLPPLRERSEDIPLLVKAFTDEFCRENRMITKGMTSRAMRVLMKYDWQGNVRELRNCIEGMVIMSNRPDLDIDDIPEHIFKSTGVSSPVILSAPTVIDTGVAALPSSGLQVEVGMSMAEIEKEVIQSTLQYAGNNRAKAAKILGVSKRTIFRKIKEHNLCDE